MALGKVTHRNTTDASVTSAKPGANYGRAKQLHLQNNAAYAFLHFNRPMPLGASVSSSILGVYTKGSWGIAPTLTIRPVQGDWHAGAITWNNSMVAPVLPVGGIIGQTTQSSAADGDLWTFDLTTHMQSVANGADWWGLRIGTDAATAKYLYSGDAALDLQPYLETVWSQAPQAPTVLVPSGGRAVSVAKPVLQCDFTDNLGSTDMAKIQVQIDAAGPWPTAAPGVASGSLDWDSGPLDATEPELDLAASTYPGLAAGAVTRWRAAVQDTSGAWSPWSDPATFRRDLKGTLTITNPAVAPNDFVSEWTPPIIWSLTGETQKAWRLFITPDDDPAEHLYDTEWVKGADSSWTLPKKVLEDDSYYRAVLQIRDTKDRQRTGTDREYTEAVRTFQFREDPTPGPVTGLIATNLTPRPWVQLEWQRSTAPDSFAIRRDGKVIESDIDPADVLVSGTTYRWTDKEARPYRSQDWKVQAVVNGKTSGGPVITLTPQMFGVWLTDPDRNIDVFIAAGKDPASGITMGEEGTTFYPLRSEHGVRITQSKRGWEGPVTGRLMDGYGFTFSQWQARFLQLMEQPRDLILSIGRESFRVDVFNMSTPPLGDLPTTDRVSFEFIQTRGLPFKPRL